MSISGLVVTLSDGPRGESALAALGADARLALGERFGPRLAVVADTTNVEADRILWDDLRAIEGVLNIEVAFVHLDPADPPHETDTPCREASHAHP